MESLFLVIKYGVLLVVTIQLIVDSIQSILEGGHKVNAGMFTLTVPMILLRFSHYVGLGMRFEMI